MEGKTVVAPTSGIGSVLGIRAADYWSRYAKLAYGSTVAIRRGARAISRKTLPIWATARLRMGSC